MTQKYNEGYLRIIFESLGIYLIFFSFQNNVNIKFYTFKEKLMKYTSYVSLILNIPFYF